MAVGPDRVQVLVQENASLGGDGADEVPYPNPINPQEDVLESCGIYFQDASNRDENVYVARAGNDMIFRDLNNVATVTLTALVGGAAAVDPAYRRHFLFMGG